MFGPNQFLESCSRTALLDRHLRACGHKPESRPSTTDPRPRKSSVLDRPRPEAVDSCLSKTILLSHINRTSYNQLRHQDSSVVPFTTVNKSAISKVGTVNRAVRKRIAHDDPEVLQSYSNDSNSPIKNSQKNRNQLTYDLAELESNTTTPKTPLNATNNKTTRPSEVTTAQTQSPRGGFFKRMSPRVRIETARLTGFNLSPRKA